MERDNKQILLRLIGLLGEKRRCVYYHALMDNKTCDGEALKGSRDYSGLFYMPQVDQLGICMQD